MCRASRGGLCRGINRAPDPIWLVTQLGVSLTSAAFNPSKRADDLSHSNSINVRSSSSTPATPKSIPIMDTVYLLDYVAGNVRSLVNAIEKIGFKIEWIENPEDIAHAEVGSSSKPNPCQILTDEWISEVNCSWRRPFWTLPVEIWSRRLSGANSPTYSTRKAIPRNLRGLASFVRGFRGGSYCARLRYHPWDANKI